MFGYITPLVPELRVKENDLYRAVYCGLCRCLGKRIGSTSRLTLSYDFVFLALVRAALSGEALTFEKRRCLVHPAAKKVMAKPCESLDYSARASAVLTYCKVLDDENDTKGFRRFGTRCLLPAAGKMRKRAQLPELDAEAGRLLSLLKEKENAFVPSADEPAGIFGELLGTFFRFGITDPAKEKIAYEIGYHTGKWIYLADAADDLPRDIKTGSYNPILASGLDGELLSGDTSALTCAMNMELRALSLAFELIPPYDAGITAILQNIIYLGLPARMEKICGQFSAASSARGEEGTDNKHE